jgi:hypothetical protein
MPFAALTHVGTDNLGDEIQSLATLARIPAPSYFLNRDRLAQESEAVEGHASLVLNGWFGQWPENWPPSDKIRPLLISMHISREKVQSLYDVRTDEFFLSVPMVKYFRSHGPVGARDLATLALLRGAGVDAYFSGCLSLTLDRPAITRNPDLIVFNDLPDSFLPHVRGRSFKHVFQTSHLGYLPQDPQERLHRANELLALYASASCVVTTRLHCALPCLAMGTPVLLIEASGDPYRFAGLKELLHHCDTESFITSAYAYDINNPPANPQRHLPLREGLLRRVEQFVAGDAGHVWQPNPLHPTEADRAAALAAINAARAA